MPGAVHVPSGSTQLSMSAEETVHFAEGRGARRVPPIHFDGGAQFTEGRRDAELVLGKSSIKDRVTWSAPGERIDPGEE